MKISSTGSVFASIALFAVSFCSEPAQAQEKHHRTFSPKGASPKGAQPRNLESTTARPATAPPPNLYPIQASFTEDFPTIGTNSDGSNLWPCLQHYHGSDGSNADCPTLGNPSLPFPKIGVVLGKPGYGWPLKNTPGVGNGFGCDGLLNGTTGPLATEYTPCGLVATWFEDATGDSTDDLIYRIVVRQGTTAIYDSGTVNFGPAGPTVTYPVDVILTSDANFGFWPGANPGPNNGNCSPDFGYPLTSAADPGFYIIASGRTCRQPVPGIATVNTRTALGTPEYTRVTGAVCTSQGVASPCYTVEWHKKYEISQDWKIFLE